MKNLIIILFTVLFSATSCSVYEEFYFSENGSVKYSLIIDASEMKKIMGTSSLGNDYDYPSDSIISFSDIIKDSLKTIPAEYANDIKNIEPINLRIQNNDSLNILKMSVYGDFKDMEAFTSAFASLAKLEHDVNLTKNFSAVDKYSFSNFFNKNTYTWDGTTLTRVVTAKEKIEEETEEIEETENTDGDKQTDAAVESMMRIFSQGQYIIKYHFPYKIKSTSNENATFSLDGKSAIINYSGSLFLEPDKNLSIKIVTE